MIWSRFAVLLGLGMVAACVDLSRPDGIGAGTVDARPAVRPDSAAVDAPLAIEAGPEPEALPAPLEDAALPADAPAPRLDTAVRPPDVGGGVEAVPDRPPPDAAAPDAARDAIAPDRAPPPTYTLLTTQVPAGTYPEPIPEEMGVRFQSAVAGDVLAIRYWKPSGESGVHVGHLWSATGTLLASVSFATESAMGWQQATLSPPVTIAPGTVYVVSVNFNVSYVATKMELAAAIVNGPLSTVADGNNGVYGAIGVFPTKTFMSNDYYRDLVFAATP